MEELLTKIVIEAPKGYEIVDKKPSILLKDEYHGSDAVLSPENGVVYTSVPFDGVFYLLRKLPNWPEIADGTMGVSEDKQHFEIGAYGYNIRDVLMCKDSYVRPWLILACKHRWVELGNYSFRKAWENFESGEEQK